MTLRAFTDLLGEPIEIDNSEVCFLTEIPVALLPSSVVAGTYISMHDGTRFAVDGTFAATVTALAFPNGSAAPFTGLDLATYGVLGDAVTGLQDVPAELLPTGAVNGTYIDFTNGLRIAVTGDLATTVAALANVGFGAVSGNVDPTLTSSGLGVLALVGGWTAFRIGKRVQWFGQFQFTPAVAGVAETISIGIASDSFISLAANFGAATDCTGSASLLGITPATDGATPIVALAGSAKLQTTITANALVNVYAFLSYAVD